MAGLIPRLIDWGPTFCARCDRPVNVEDAVAVYEWDDQLREIERLVHADRDECARP